MDKDVEEYINSAYVIIPEDKAEGFDSEWDIPIVRTSTVVNPGIWGDSPICYGKETYREEFI